MWIGEDLGTQRSPMISMEMFRNHILPRHMPVIDLAKSHDLPIMIHTCGSSSWSHDDCISARVTVLDTLQPEPADMSPAYLANQFGDRASFHGCISTTNELSFGSTQDVEDQVVHTLEIMMPTGGICCRRRTGSRTIPR